MNIFQSLLLCMLFRHVNMDDAKVNAVNITSDFVILYKLYKKIVWKMLARDDYQIKGFQCIVISFHLRLFFMLFMVMC